MKKLLSYILILIISIGLLVPIHIIKAVDEPLGTCTYTYFAYGIQKYELTRTFKTNCTGADRSWKESTLAEFQAEKAAREGTGDENDGTDDGFVGPVDPYYHFLAPLPCEPGTPDCDISGKLITFDPTGKNKIGGYLNVMIRIFIGMCAVLAVIMIVVGGIEYMTSELISNKENGKHRITGAIFGLVLALGAWTLLNTINPDLLNTDLTSLQNVEIEVTLADETETIDSAVRGGETFSGPTGKCPEGIKKSKNGIWVCSSIADKLDKLIDDSKIANLTISGGGFRSPEAQKALRITNCNGDYTNPKAPCKTPTAIPGQSRHNNGSAVDFTCDGNLIQTKDNKCFIWLKANASKYGLQNYSAEPWHWSTDGR